MNPNAVINSHDVTTLVKQADRRKIRMWDEAGTNTPIKTNVTPNTIT
jgi:hypothetical protein